MSDDAPKEPSTAEAAASEREAARLSRMLFESRELLDMYSDMLELRSKGAGEWPRRTRDDIDAYRAERGWSPHGFGGERDYGTADSVYVRLVEGVQVTRTSEVSDRVSIDRGIAKQPGGEISETVIGVEVMGPAVSVEVDGHRVLSEDDSETLRVVRAKVRELTSTKTKAETHAALLHIAEMLVPDAG